MLSQTYSQPTGIVVRRGASSAANAYRVRSSFEFRPYNSKPYFILTAFT
ncbi:RNase A-like domain-containing protein [Pantoea dispersa]|nr:RNase A-like domain-containing protein [Pantoea dispersa]